MATTILYSLIASSSSEEEPQTRKDIQFEKLAEALSPIPMEDVLAQINRLEKRTFPKSEAMNFDAELKKRNTEMIVVLDTSPSSEAMTFTISEATRKPPKSLLDNHPDNGTSSSTNVEAPPLDNLTKALVVAYLVHARSAGASLLHKVCVSEKHRRQGIGRKLLTILKSKLEIQGCERIQLWVDWQRDSAIELYKQAGFRRIDGARDYYGAGRHGVKMAIDLNWVW